MQFRAEKSKERMKFNEQYILITSEKALLFTVSSTKPIQIYRFEIFEQAYRNFKSFTQRIKKYRNLCIFQLVFNLERKIDPY